MDKSLLSSRYYLSISLTWWCFYKECHFLEGISTFTRTFESVHDSRINGQNFCLLILFGYFCRVLVYNRWVFRENEATTKFVKSIVPTIVPLKGLSRHLLFIKNTMEKQASAQGMGRHTPREINDIGHGDLHAIETFIGNGLIGFLALAGQLQIIFCSTGILKIVKMLLPCFKGI